MPGRAPTVLAAAAASVAVGAGGYALGHSSRSVPHTSHGTTAPPAQLRAATDAGRRAGFTAGRREGFAAGEASGIRHQLAHDRKAQGDAFDAGYQAAFQGFGSSWDTSRPYVVEVTQDGRGRYSLSSRLVMDPGQSYQICTSGSGICAGSSSSGGSTTTNPQGATDFCATHVCIPSFNSGTGYIVQCGDGQWSHSGGVQGACSDHLGETSRTYP